jgi:hypothetical protein
MAVWCLFFTAIVSWDGQDTSLSVQEADGAPLVGMGLLYGHEVYLQVLDGGNVAITRLP